MLAIVVLKKWQLLEYTVDLNVEIQIMGNKISINNLNSTPSLISEIKDAQTVDHFLSSLIN